MEQCFICLETICKSNTPGNCGPDTGNFKALIVTACQLLKLKDVEEYDWASIKSSKVPVCCSQCFETLKVIQDTHNILVKAQEKLKQYLQSLETLVVNSDKSFKRKVELLSYARGCQQFRNQLINRNQGSSENPALSTAVGGSPPKLEDDWLQGHLCENDDDHVNNTFVQSEGRNGRKRRRIVVIAEEDEIRRLSSVTTMPTGPVENAVKPRRRLSNKKPVVREHTSDSECDSDPASYLSGDDWMPDEQEEKEMKTGRAPRKKNSKKFKFRSCKWITCGIKGCSDQFYLKSDWWSHAKQVHQDYDSGLETHWTRGGIKLLCRSENCGQVIGNKEQFYAHLQAYHPNRVRKLPNRVKRIVTCDMCRKPVSQQDLAKHVRDHVGDYALNCSNPNCKLIFCTLKYLKDHVNNVSLCKDFTSEVIKFDICQVCGFTGTTTKGLQSHLLFIHDRESTFKPYQCPVSSCPEKFAHRQSVYFHISHRHSSARTIALMVIGSTQKCSQCSEMVPVEQIANHFVNIHEADPDSIISCKYCPYKAVSRLRLFDHYPVHIKAGSPVSCDLCPEKIKFTRLGTLRQHYLEKHQIGKSFICEHCPNVFTVEGNLKSHIKKYHSGSEVIPPARNQICDQCSNENPPRFSSMDLLTEHKIKYHGAQPFKCETCGEMFIRKKHYVEHVKGHLNIASGVVHQCDIPGCGVICVSKAGLAEHKQSIAHIGRTNAVKCPECDSTFNTEFAMKNHHKRVHIADRKFVCDTCGVGFKNGIVLRHHVMIHTGEKPHQCPVCGKTFRQKTHLKSHSKTHEPH